MPVSKLKNLAILILLLANAALVCLLIPRQLEKHAQEQALRDSLTALCAEQNVILQPECIGSSLTLYTLELNDRADAEAAALSDLLEDSSTTPSWDNGVLSLRLEGQKSVSDLRSHAKNTLKKMQFQISALSAPVRRSPGIYDVTATQSVLGVPVFSEGLTFTYANNSLRDINGTFFTGTLIRADDTVCCSAAEAVVAFLGERVELGWVGSTITGLEQGYLPADLTGLVRLLPGWKLTTDTGSFYVNGLDGTVQSAQ